MSASASLILSLCLSWFLTRLYKYVKSRKALPLPPGPKPLPLVGNWFDIPKARHPWIKIAELGKTYGDMIYMGVFGVKILYANSLAVAQDLLDKRSAVYSSRPSSVMLSEIIGWKWIFAFMPYGPVWREHRRIFHQFFHQAASLNYRQAEVEAARTLLLGLLDTPQDFLDHLRRSAIGTIMDGIYGIKINDLNDKYVKIAHEAAESFFTITPGKYLVDSIPLLKHVPDWFPGAEFKRVGKRFNTAMNRFRDEPYEAAKEAIKDGKSLQCGVSIMLHSEEKLDEEIIKNIAGVSYAGGADTTISALQTFFMAMALFPQAQKKAQKELDAVIGTKRLPEFSDRESLPYIEAIFWECLRWNPVTPTVIPHVTTDNDEYRGYLIPKGTLVVTNDWRILHDERAYPDPHTFNPDRFLDRNGNIDPTVQSPSVACFGFGRRICPGRHMAKDTAFITIASVLSVFDIKPAIDEITGLEIPIEQNMSSHIVSCPEPFECSITPRRDKHALKDIIQRALASQ